MSIRDLKQHRKNVAKEKCTFSLPKQVVDALTALHADDPSRTASQVAGDAIRFAYAMGMYQNFRMHASISNKKFKVQAELQDKDSEKSLWAQRYGAKVEGKTCSYTAYEVTVAGMVMKWEREVPVPHLPETEDEIRKMILGPFASINEAERSLAAQELRVPIRQEVPGRGPKRKK